MDPGHSRRPTVIGIGAAAGLASARWTMPSHTMRTLSTFGGVDQGYWRLMRWSEREDQWRDRLPGPAWLTLDFDHSARAVELHAVEHVGHHWSPRHIAPCGLAATPSYRVPARLTVISTLNLLGVVSLMDSKPVSSMWTGIPWRPGRLKS